MPRISSRGVAPALPTAGLVGVGNAPRQVRIEAGRSTPSGGLIFGKCDGLTGPSSAQSEQAIAKKYSNADILAKSVASRATA